MRVYRITAMTTDIKDWDLSGVNKTAYQRFSDGIEHLTAKKQYKTKLDQFLAHIEKDADFIADLGREALSDPAKVQGFQNLLNKALSEMMIRAPYQINTMNYFQRVLRKFFETNGITFKYTFRANVEVGQDHPELFKKNSAQPMSNDEMRSIMTRLGNSRNTAMCFFSRDTGLRLQDCVEIKVKQIQPILGDSPPEYFVFEELYYPLKNVHQAQAKQTDPLPATLIMGYESVRYVRAWMRERDQLLRKYGVNPNDPEGYVFCTTQNMKQNKVGDKGSKFSVSNSVRMMRKKLGLREGLSFHSFRNNHSTDLITGGVPELFVLVLQGKTGNSGSIRDYTNPPKAKLLDFYKKAYSTLALDTVESEAVKSLSETVKQQEEENKALTLRIDWLEDFLQGLQEKEQNKPTAFSNAVRTLGFSRNGETQFLHPTKGVYKVVYDEKPKEEEKVDPLDAILADPDFRARLAEKIRKGEF